MSTPRKSEQEVANLQAESDRYPSLRKVLHWAAENAGAETRTVEHLEVFAYAGGDASYRVWPPRAEDPIIGYVSAEELGAS